MPDAERNPQFETQPFSETQRPRGAVIYAIESFRDCVMEINQHISRHWEEVASRKDIRALDPDWTTYLQADRMGRITLATARASGERGPVSSGKDRLVGYLVMMQRNDLNSKETIAAESAVYYVEPRPIRALIQRSLIRFVRDELLRRGVTYQRFRTKISHSNEPILRNLGYEPDEILYILQPGKKG